MPESPRRSSPRPEGRAGDLLELVDATSGVWDDLGSVLGLRVGVFDQIEERTGAPVASEEAQGFLDPLCWRFHDLLRETPAGVADRRMSIATVNDYEGSRDDPEEGMAPFGQVELFTALNRSTRERDLQGRVALPGSLRKIVDDSENKYSLALASGYQPIAGASAEEVVGPTGDAGGGLPQGVQITPAGAEGGVVSRQPRVSIGGLTFFGEAAVSAAQEAAARGGDATDVARWASAAARGTSFPPILAKDDGGGATQTRPKPPEPDRNPEGSPPDRPQGYCWDGRAVGVLSSFFVPRGQGGKYATGREGTPIGPLPKRHDAQTFMPPGLVGRTMYVPNDAAAIEKKPGTLFKGEMWFDSSRANVDTEVGHETGQWRPVVAVDARIRPSHPPPPPPPPPWTPPPPEEEEEEDEGGGTPPRPETGGGRRPETGGGGPPPPAGGGDPPELGDPPPPGNGPGRGGGKEPDVGGRPETGGGGGGNETGGLHPQGGGCGPAEGEDVGGSQTGPGGGGAPGGGGGGTETGGKGGRTETGGTETGGQLPPTAAPAGQQRNYEQAGVPCVNSTGGKLVPFDPQGQLNAAHVKPFGGFEGGGDQGVMWDVHGYPAVQRGGGVYAIGGREQPQSPIPVGLPINDAPGAGFVVEPGPDAGIPRGAEERRDARLRREARERAEEARRAEIDRELQRLTDRADEIRQAAEEARADGKNVKADQLEAKAKRVERTRDKRLDRLNRQDARELAKLQYEIDVQQRNRERARKKAERAEQRRQERRQRLRDALGRDPDTSGRPANRGQGADPGQGAYILDTSDSAAVVGAGQLGQLQDVGSPVADVTDSNTNNPLRPALSEAEKAAQELQQLLELSRSEFPEGHPGREFGEPLFEADFGDHNVANTPAPFLGQPGGPQTVEDWAHATTHHVRALQAPVNGLLGGPSFYEGNLGLESRNRPGKPPAGSSIRQRTTSTEGVHVKQGYCTSPLSVYSIMDAKEGGKIEATGGGVFEVVREHRQSGGEILDSRPLMLLENDRGVEGALPDVLASPDRRLSIDGGNQITGQGLKAERFPGERENLLSASVIDPQTRAVLQTLFEVDPKSGAALFGGGDPGAVAAGKVAIYPNASGQAEVRQADGTTVALTAGVTDHGALTGLSDDDHSQYLRADGTRQVAGDLKPDGPSRVLGGPSNNWGNFHTRALNLWNSSGAQAAAFTFAGDTSRSIAVPNADGTLALTSDIPSVDTTLTLTSTPQMQDPNGSTTLAGSQVISFAPHGGAELACTLGASTAGQNYFAAPTFHTLSEFLQVSSSPGSPTAGGTVTLVSPIIRLPDEFDSWQDTAIAFDWSVYAEFASSNDVDLSVSIAGVPNSGTLEDQLGKSGSSTAGTTVTDYDNTVSFTATEMSEGVGGGSSFTWAAGDQIQITIQFTVPTYNGVTLGFGQIRLNYNTA